MSEQKQQEPIELNEEQIEEREAAMDAQKKELIKFYKKELPLLRLQAEYEKALADIDVSKMQRFEIMMAKAQMMNQDQEPLEDKQDSGNRTGEHMKPAKEPNSKRKLKKVENAV